MTLVEYLASIKKSFADAASELEISKAYVGQLATGKSTPGLRLAQRIFRWSNGAVAMDGWIK